MTKYTSNIKRPGIKKTEGDTKKIFCNGHIYIKKRNGMYKEVY